MTSPPSSALQVVAVIVTYKRLTKLRATIARTLAQPCAQVVVVCVASTDGMKDWLDGLTDPRLLTKHEATNRGGAGGFALGFAKAARHPTAEWLVCCDDDAYPETDALSTFAGLVLDASVGAVAAAVRLVDGGISPMNRPGVSPFQSPRQPWRALRRRANRFGVSDSAYASAARPVSYSLFVGRFMRCDLVRGSVGLPRAELYICGDDTLYTLDIFRQGFILLFAPTVRFIHHCATLVQQRRVYKPLWKAYYTFRNGLTFYRKLSGFYFYPVMLPILRLSLLGPSLQYTDRRRFSRVARTEIGDGLRGNFGRAHEEVIRLVRD